MTVQYDGGDNYTVHLGNRTIIFPKEEIEEIQGFNFETMKPFDEEEDLDTFKFEASELADELEELISDHPIFQEDLGTDILQIIKKLDQR